MKPKPTDLILSCPVCSGTGELDGARCETCDGSGWELAEAGNAFLNEVLDRRNPELKAELVAKEFFVKRDAES